MIAAKIVLLLAATIVAFWLSAICGGGASLILIPILNILLPASLVPFSLTLGTLSSSTSRIYVFKNYINWKIFYWFVPFSIPAVLIGAYLIKFINPTYLQIIVAIFLIANLPQLLFSKSKQTQGEKPYPNFVLAIIGFLAGFVSGITGAIGLLFNRFYLKYGLTKEEIVATRAANEVTLHLIKLIIYIMLGLYSKLAIIVGITIALGAIISSYSVKYILPYLSEFIFRKIGYGAMVISGFILFISTSTQIIKNDQISLSNTYFKDRSETTMNWRNSHFTLEYSLNEGIEMEIPIQSDELPNNLLNHYKIIRPQYDDIFIEKVFKLWGEVEYEFYCYKNNKLSKFDY